MDREAGASFSDRVCDLLTQITSGQCPITEDMIRNEADENNASVLSGLQLLWEDLNYQAERREVAEDELRRREARYRALYSQAKVCIWDCDLREVVRAIPDDESARASLLDSIDELRALFRRIELVSVNEQSLQQFRAADRDALSQKLGSLVVPESQPLVAGLVTALARGDHAFETEGVLQTLDGRPLHVIW